MPPRIIDQKERILRLCVPEPNSGCWLWLGAVTGHGYGVVGVGYKSEGNRRIIQAHRRSYEIFVGSIPNGKDICHHCDNRLCVNPEHLFVGSRLENVHDMMRKGRYWGRRKPSAKKWNEKRRQWAIP